MSIEKETDTTEVKKQVDAEETSTESQEETQETEEEASNIDNIDYKAIAEKALADKKAAEDALATKRFKSSNPKTEVIEEEIDEENQPMTRKDFAEFQAQERQRIQNEYNKHQIQEVAGNIAETDDEKQAILAVHANRIFPEEMSVKDQLEEVKLVVNKDKIFGENSELKRALNSKANSSKEFISGQHDSIESKAGEPKLSGNRKEILKDFTFNKATKQYEKKLSSGVLVHDPKTGKNKFVSNNS